jgi:hypothetical protein
VVQTTQGMYVDGTRERGAISIQEAITRGAIRVEESQFISRSNRELNVGLVTVTKKKRRRHKLRFAQTKTQLLSNMKDVASVAEGSNVAPNYTRVGKLSSISKTVYVIETVLDSKQNDRVPYSEASQLGLVDESTNQFRDSLTGKTMPITAAIQQGYITGPQLVECVPVSNTGPSDNSTPLSDKVAENAATAALADRIRDLVSSDFDEADSCK